MSKSQKSLRKSWCESLQLISMDVADRVWSLLPFEQEMVEIAQSAASRDEFRFRHSLVI